MAGGGPSSTTTRSTTEPPAYAIPYFKDYLEQLTQLVRPGSTIDPKTGKVTGGGVAKYPGGLAEVAPFSPSQEEALGFIRGMGPYSPVANAAAEQNIRTMRGDYLGPNPYLNDYYNAAASGLVNQYQQATAPDITANAVAQGALGGSGQNQSQQYAKWGLGENLGHLGAQIYEPAYQFERGQQTAAVGQAPSTIGAQYIPSQQMLGAGGMEQTQLQNILNTALQNINTQGMWPYQALSQYGQGLGVGAGGSQTIVAPNPSQGIK
jgi:hypothetical protein